MYGVPHYGVQYQMNPQMAMDPGQNNCMYQQTFPSPYQQPSQISVQQLSQTSQVQNPQHIQTPQPPHSMSQQDGIIPMQTNVEQEWQTQNVRKHKRNSTDQPRTKQKKLTDYWLSAPETSNRFESLSDSEDGPQKNEESKEPRPPPIFIYGVHNLKPLTDMLDIHAKDKYFIKLIGNAQAKVQLSETKDYSTVIKVLKDKNTEFHSFQHKQDRKFRVVLRNMHPTVDMQELTKEINDHGHTVLNIYNIKHRINKTALPLFFVELAQSQNNKDIYNIEFLMKSRITFEPPHVKREVIQCLNCQRFGHSRNYCYRTPRCVKCAGEHLTKNCERKERNKNVKCVNCQGNHPANYRGCLVAKEIQRRKFPPLRSKQNSQLVQPGISYAQKVTDKNQQPQQVDIQQQTQNWNQSTENKIETMMVKLMERMDTMLNILTTMISKLP